MRKISFFFFTFTSFLSFSQDTEKIVVVKQDQIFFYQMNYSNDSSVVKNKSDQFLIKMSSDKKACTEIKLKNATFLKTDNEYVFKLIYTPGMKYRLIYAASAQERAGGIEKDNRYYENNYEMLKLLPQIATDGAINDNSSKEIVIELINNKTENVLIKNVFYYKEK